MSDLLGLVQRSTLCKIRSVFIHTLAFDDIFQLSDGSLFDPNYFCFLFKLFR